MDAQEKKNKGVAAIINGKMDAYGITKKTLYSILGIVGCLFLTVVMSITGLGFDPSVFATWNYWTGMIIQFAIAIFSMITGRKIGDDRSRNSKEGQYRKELGYYRAEYNKAIDLKLEVHFQDWLNVYREKKTKDNIRNAMIEYSIQQPEVLDLDFTELDKLEKPYLKVWDDTPFYDKYYNEKKGKAETKFMSLNKEQIKAVKAIKGGAVAASYVSASYFLNALKGTSIDEWENAAKSNNKKGGIITLGYSFRLIMMLLLSLLANGLTTVPYESAGGVMLNIAIRIFVLVSSTIWGIYLGFEVVDMDTVLLAYKTLMIKQCVDEYNSGMFKPESVEEKAEKEYDEAKAKEQEAINSVVSAEPINSVPMIGTSE